jgi:hypothetical protein
MKPWMVVRFSTEEVSSGVIARLMRDLMPLALQVHKPDDVGVFSSDLGSQHGKCVYFSPGAVKVFASALEKLPVRPCDPPSLETLSLLYGASECLPSPVKPVGEAESPRILRVEELVE